MGLNSMMKLQKGLGRLELGGRRAPVQSGGGGAWFSTFKRLLFPAANDTMEDVASGGRGNVDLTKSSAGTGTGTGTGKKIIPKEGDEKKVKLPEDSSVAMERAMNVLSSLPTSLFHINLTQPPENQGWRLKADTSFTGDVDLVAYEVKQDQPEEEPKKKHNAKFALRKEGFLVFLMVPGFDKSDLNIILEDDILNITGKAMTESGALSLHEIIELPDDIFYDVQSVHAHVVNGVLKVVFPLSDDDDDVDVEHKGATKVVVK